MPISTDTNTTTPRQTAWLIAAHAATSAARDGATGCPDILRVLGDIQQMMSEQIREGQDPSEEEIVEAARHMGIAREVVGQSWGYHFPV